MEISESIDVVVMDSPDVGDDVKGGLAEASAERVAKRVSLATLRANMTAFVHSLSSTFKDIDTVGDYKLKEIELQVEITASGGFALVGTAQLESKGAIALRFARE